MRNKTERAEGVTSGVAKLVNIKPPRIKRAISDLYSNEAQYRLMASGTNPYGDGRVARIINRMASSV